METAERESAIRYDVQLAKANKQHAAQIRQLQDALAAAQQDVARAEASTATEVAAEVDDVTARGDVDGSERAERIGEPSGKMRWTRRAKARLAAYIAAGMGKARIARLIACEFLVAVSMADIAAMIRTRWVRGADGYLWAS